MSMPVQKNKAVVGQRSTARPARSAASTRGSRRSDMDGISAPIGRLAEHQLAVPTTPRTCWLRCRPRSSAMPSKPGDLARATVGESDRRSRPSPTTYHSRCVRHQAGPRERRAPRCAASPVVLEQQDERTAGAPKLVAQNAPVRQGGSMSIGVACAVRCVVGERRRRDAAPQVVPQPTRRPARAHKTSRCRRRRNVANAPWQGPRARRARPRRGRKRRSSPSPTETTRGTTGRRPAGGGERPVGGGRQVELAVTTRFAMCKLAVDPGGDQKSRRLRTGGKRTARCA